MGNMREMHITGCTQVYRYADIQVLEKVYNNGSAFLLLTKLICAISFLYTFFISLGYFMTRETVLE